MTVKVSVSMIVMCLIVSTVFAGECGVVMCDDLGTLAFIDGKISANQQNIKNLEKQKNEIINRSKENNIIEAGSFAYPLSKNYDKIRPIGWFDKDAKTETIPRHYCYQRDAYVYSEPDYFGGRWSFWISEDYYKTLPPHIKKLFKKPEV